MVDWDEQQEPTIAGLGVGGQLSGSTRHHVRNTPTNLPSLPSQLPEYGQRKNGGRSFDLCTERYLNHAIMTNIITDKGDNF